MSKLMTEEQVVAELRSGMTIGIGGWGSRRKPMSLVRAILRSDLRDLTVVSYGGPDVGLLCAAGKVKKLVYGFVSLDSIPLEPHFRQARQAGSIEAVELDEGMYQWGLYAAALRLPFLPTRAGLVPLTLSGKHQERLDGLAGVALPVEAHCNGASFRNAMLFTHRGVSGPAILQISSYWNPGDVVHVDLLPGGDAFSWLRAQRAARGSGELRGVLAERLPRRFVQALCEHWFGERRLGDLGDAALREIATLLHDWPLVASGTEGWRTAEVTLGGVDTDGLSSATMQSKRVPGLYFVGEVVDVTGWLGGYNFQWAWASAHACATAL